MEDWSSRRVRTLVAQKARRGLSANEIASALISMMARSTCSNQRSRISVMDDRLKREGKHSPNAKYRSRSALLQERASKLVSGSGELTTRVEPAMIGCEA
jgi:hypothetical protein